MAMCATSSLGPLSFWLGQEKQVTKSLLLKPSYRTHKYEMNCHQDGNLIYLFLKYSYIFFFFFCFKLMLVFFLHPSLCSPSFLCTLPSSFPFLISHQLLHFFLLLFWLSQHHFPDLILSFLFLCNFLQMLFLKPYKGLTV